MPAPGPRGGGGSALIASASSADTARSMTIDSANEPEPSGLTVTSSSVWTQPASHRVAAQRSAARGTRRAGHRIPPGGGTPQTGSPRSDPRRCSLDAAHLEAVIVRPLSGCVGRLLPEITFRNAAICSFEAWIGRWSTNHATCSEHGGVVSEPE